MADKDDVERAVAKIVNLEPKNDIAAAGDALRRSEEILIQNAKVIARIRRANYLAYIEAGFSKEEALQLCVK